MSDLRTMEGFNNAPNCLICTKPFKSPEKKLGDHNHLTSEYPKHNACNLNYRIDPKKVKIPFQYTTLKVYRFYVVAIYTIGIS